MSSAETGPSHEGRGAVVAQLLRVRLLVPAAKSPSRAELKKALEPLFQHRHTGAEWGALFDEALDGLIAVGDVTAKPLDLTEAGRRTALAFLGLETLPPKVNWQSLKNSFLVARALELPAADADTRKRLGNSDNLRALLLKKRHELATADLPTLAQAINALAWKQLDIADAQNFTREAVLIRCLGLEGKPNPKQVRERLAIQAVGARNTRTDELRLALLRQWLDAPPPGPPPAPPVPVAFELAAFARAALDAARASSTGRFGEHKVFINHVWRQMQTAGTLGAMTEAEFKQHLIEANRDGLLSLSRADFVEVMDRGDLAASETSYLNATFHFLQT